MRATSPTSREDRILLTGATGLVGAGVLRRLLVQEKSRAVYVLVRSPERLPCDLRSRSRVVPLTGDITLPGLGLDADVLRRLAGSVGVVIHSAADTRFSQTREEARRTNVLGTRNVLEVAASWRRPPRVCLVSTVFVSGRRAGNIPEGDCDPEWGWVNAYEQSKYEAESAVQGSGLPHLICRASTIVCDTPAGSITQLNAIHGALKVCFRGLVPMLPGDDANPVDVVPCDYVSSAIAELALREDAEGATYQLAAGSDALPLGELFDDTYAYWASLNGRARARVRPLMTDLDTYRLFESTVLETAEPHLRRVTRALSYFAPQLAIPKVFETELTDAALGRRPPPVRQYWPRMLAVLAELWRREEWAPSTEREDP